MILAGMGLTLVWCGIRDEDPRAVVAGVFSGQRHTDTGLGKLASGPKPITNPPGQLGGILPTRKDTALGRIAAGA